MQVLVVGGGAGKGVAVNNRTRGQTYMRMVEGQAGLGLSARKLQLVWAFDTEQKFNDFVNKGWTLGGQGSASATYEKKGGSYEGAVQVEPGVWLYQLTETGLALELTVQGSKYYKDDQLN
jgi:lipid-binding SYLF domain-containing protein